MEAIQEEIDKVITAFKKGQELALNATDIAELVKSLQLQKGKFQSVFFEGAAAYLSASLEENSKAWTKFVKHPQMKPHIGQVWVGFGWGMAEKNREIIPFIQDLNAFEKWKALDGYGYFHGLLRKRRFIKGQSIPENIEAEELLGFDQGLGRSLWYNAKGDVEKLAAELSHFDKKRLPAVWRGVGLAAFYVGGWDRTSLQELKALSGDYQTSFLLGVAIAILGRKHAQTLKKESLEAFTELVDKPAEEILQQIEYPFEKEWTLSEWIEAIESQLEV